MLRLYLMCPSVVLDPLLLPHLCLSYPHIYVISPLNHLYVDVGPKRGNKLRFGTESVTFICLYVTRAGSKS